MLQRPPKPKPPASPRHWIMGFDLGNSFGWTGVDTKTGQMEHGSKDVSPGRGESTGMRGLKFERCVEDLFDLINPAAVYYEKVERHPNPGGGQNIYAAHCYGALETLLLMICERRNIPCSGIPVGTIKKHATGNGGASKQAVINAAKAKGWKPAHGGEWNVKKDDDEADSMFVADYARVTYHVSLVDKLKIVH